MLRDETKWNPERYEGNRPEHVDVGMISCPLDNNFDRDKIEQTVAR